MTSISAYSEEPTHTIKKVQKLTGIKPVTLRAWERRYELVVPTRMDNGYRLYSDRDVQILLWVNACLKAGQSISQVAKRLHAYRDRGEWPSTSLNGKIRSTHTVHVPRPARHYAEILFGALVAHQEERANVILEDCLGFFNLLTIMEEIITPCLDLLYEAWYHADIPLATEHIAHEYLKGRLLTLYHSLPLVRDGGLILACCGPEDMRELGSLMLSVALRQEGYRVEYLGPDLPVDDLVDYSEISHPRLICMSVDTDETAALVRSLPARLAELKSKPKLGCFGRFFEKNPEVRMSCQGVFLGTTIYERLETIHRLLAFA